MALPNIIEYLCAIQAAGKAGTRLVHQGVGQVTFILRPNQLVTYTATPAAGNYCNIIYNNILDPLVVPGALSISAQYMGSRVLSGVLSGWTARENAHEFVLVTEADPAIVQIQNLTNVSQYYSGLGVFLTIKTETDYWRVVELIHHIHLSGSAELAEILATAGGQ